MLRLLILSFSKSYLYQASILSTCRHSFNRIFRSLRLQISQKEAYNSSFHLLQLSYKYFAFGGTDNTIDKICMNFKDLGKIVEQDQLLQNKSGGFGQLYRRKRENGFTAVKKIIINDGFTVENAFHEARVHSMLVHPNIPKYYDHYFNAEENVMEIEMEYFEGFNLQRVANIKNKGHGLIYLANLAKQIIRTLEYIHSQGIIHFDLSVRNILVNFQRQIKIIDFGSALFRSDFQPCQKIPSIRTATHFSTPENIKWRMRVTGLKQPSDFLLKTISKAVNFSVDVYSFGVCLYYLAVGDYPFRGQTRVQVLQNILKKSVDFNLLPTPWLKNLLRNLLNKNPQKRYTISQIIDYLQKVAIQEGESCLKKIKIL